MRRIVTAAVVALVAVAAFGRTAPSADEFVGPFTNWANVKTDFGAVGDGKADDTVALQKAFDSFMQKSMVLYLPAGTYRITKGLMMTSHMNVRVVGEDPAKTIVKWDGGDGDTMLLCNGVRYSTIGRITWDGSGKKVTAVWHRWDGHTPNAATGLEHADEVFKDVDFGIRAGMPHFMDAECPIYRCRFIRCAQVGVSIESFNALDWWVWYGRFEDCKVGVSNAADGQYGGGHFHVYESLFERSQDADIKMGHTSYLGIRGNTSVGSRTFFRAVRPAVGAGTWKPTDTWAGQVLMENNTVLDPQDDTPVRIASASSLFMLDNVFRGRESVTAPVALSEAPAAPAIVAVGNTVTVQKPYSTTGTVTDVDTKIVEPKTIKVEISTPPEAPPKVTRPVLEVPAKANGEQIQALIDQAAKLKGKRPVIHFPAGRYGAEKTLEIPANTDMQLIGDAGVMDNGVSGIYLGGKVGIHIRGPSQVYISSLALMSGSKEPDATVLLVDGVDQPGGRVYGDQLWSDTLAKDLKHARVELRAAQPIGGLRPSIVADNATLALFGGASTGYFMYDVLNHGTLAIRDIWYESGADQWAHLHGPGNVTFNGVKIACMPFGRAATNHTVHVDNFDGKFTGIGMLMTANNYVGVTGTAKTKALLLASQFVQSEPRYLIENKNARFGILANRREDYQNGGTSLVADEGDRSPEFLREMLADVRAIHPTPYAMEKGVTCVRLHRLNLGFQPGNPSGRGLVVTH